MPIIDWPDYADHTLAPICRSVTAVTAVGFSAILDVVPNRSRGLAMSLSFFLDVALGAGLGHTAVALAASHVFGPARGLGAPIAMTAAGGYLVALLGVGAALLQSRFIEQRSRMPSCSRTAPQGLL